MLPLLLLTAPTASACHGDDDGGECTPLLDLGPAAGFNVFSCTDWYGGDHH